MQQKKPSKEAIIVSEYRLINAIIKNPAYFEDSRVSSEIFSSEVAKSLYEAVDRIYARKESVTPANLLQTGLEIDYNVSREIVNAIFSIDNEGAQSLDDILEVLSNEKEKEAILEKIDSLKSIASSAGSLDDESFKKDLYDIEEILKKGSETKSTLMSFEDWSNNYKEDLKARIGGRKYSFGDIFLDKDIYKGAYPGAITIVAGTPGMGKSTFVLSLIDNLLERNSPCMYISLEMSGVDTFDRLMSKKLDMDSSVLYDKDLIGDVEAGVDKLKERLDNHKNFYFVEDPDVSMSKLRSMIREFKQRTKQDYCLVVIDLLTQMKGFLANSSMRGAGTPQTIENSMNELNALAKSENVHIIGVAQFNRGTDSGKVTSIESIQNFRPTANDIKNSSALLERARLVLSVFRAKPYAIKYLVDSQGNPFPEVEDMEDYLELQVLKNSSGEVGKIYKYFYDGAHFRLLPLSEADEEKMNRMVEDDDY